MPRNLEVPSFMYRERLASFATVGRDNEPHVVPVFFTYDGGRVYIQTDRSSVKVRNLSGNSKVAVAVYSEEQAVIIKGKGRVIAGDADFIKRTQEHIEKYELILDKDGRDSMGIPLFSKKKRCVIEVIPKRTIFW